MLQVEMAERLGVSRGHLNAIVCGRIRPGGQLAVKLATETKVPVMVWLTGTKEERRAAWQKMKEARP